MQEATAQYRGLASAADACVCMLRILTVPGLRREHIAEDHVEAALAFLKFHLSANALAFADARLCRQYRPDISATGEHLLQMSSAALLGPCDLQR